MTPQTRMLVIRDLTAEHVFARRMFPQGEKGLVIKDGKVSPGPDAVAQLVAENGPAAQPGDKCVISNVVFKDKAIIFEINGGPKKHQKWYKHIDVGMNGTESPIGGPDTSLNAHGSMVTLQFDGPVPEITGEQVRQMLDPVFDFKALSVAEAYAKTLPPKVQAAIKDHQVLVGMDKEMVIYAKGRAPRKIRDKDEQGHDYEEWIYGDPPQEVDFVRFNGDLVTRLEIMTVDGQKIVRTQKEVDIKDARDRSGREEAAASRRTRHRCGVRVKTSGAMTARAICAPRFTRTIPASKQKMPRFNHHAQRPHLDPNRSGGQFYFAALVGRREIWRATASRLYTEGVRIALGQINTTVGDFAGNSAKIIEFAQRGQAFWSGADSLSRTRGVWISAARSGGAPLVRRTQPSYHRRNCPANTRYRRRLRPGDARQFLDRQVRPEFGRSAARRKDRLPAVQAAAARPTTSSTRCAISLPPIVRNWPASPANPWR